MLAYNGSRSVYLQTVPVGLMKSREFAIQVVQKLQQAGFQALWAGGCVRDQLLGLPPKDYDVATAATPEQVREVFGYKRTLPIGASFGVITVLGPRNADPIEVATFRRDGGYSDGRRPDTVQYTDAREDALRRDFTINGMFFDPIEDKVLDFVGGQADLKLRQIRAIGVAEKRIEEDKLRMLRGVRFAAKYGFEIEDKTLEAIRDRAVDLTVVSNERIGAEMQRMLADPNRAIAVGLLRKANLLTQVVLDENPIVEDQVNWKRTLSDLARLESQNFCAAAVILLEPILRLRGADAIAVHWKLSNQQKKTIDFAMAHKSTLAGALRQPWSVIQPLLLSPFVGTAVAVLGVSEEAQTVRSVQLIRERLAWPNEQLDPPPLLTGKDLIAGGIEPGPDFKRFLDACRAKQLDGEFKSKRDAMEYLEAEI